MAKSRRKMSAKQIKHFGTKRQKAALKAKRHAPAKRNTARRSAPRRAAPRKNTARKRPNTSHRRRTKRNPELVSFLLGNSAQRSTKGMARSRKKTKRAASHRNTAGTRRRTITKPVHHRRRSRGNPAGIPLKEFAFGGAGVLAGFVGSAALPQLLAAGSNTGMTGYALTAGATIALTILSHMVFPRNRAITFGVGAGGAANLLRRILTDQTPFGSYLNQSGMGDYMVANWGPPRMNNGLFSAMAEAPGTPWGGNPGGGMITSSGVGIQDMADIRSARPC